MLSIATHSKLREALDGTDTQVATCTIDRWKAKMKGAEKYITVELHVFYVLKTYIKIYANCGCYLLFNS